MNSGMHESEAKHHEHEPSAVIRSTHPGHHRLRRTHRALERTPKVIMSRHHRAQKWTTHAPKLRAAVEAQLPMPCVNCGQMVLREHKWQVGHIRDAALGGKPTIANVGASHVKSDLWPRNCNQIAGGKLGAAITNTRRRHSQGIREW